MSERHMALREEFFRKLDALVRDACQRWHEQEETYKPGMPLRVDYFLRNVLVTSGRPFWRRARDGAKDLNVPALVSENSLNAFCSRIEPYAEPQQLADFREFVERVFLKAELAGNNAKDNS